MKRRGGTMVGVLVLVAAGLPQAWAEREKKPAPPPTKPKAPAKPPAVDVGKMVLLEGGSFVMGSEDDKDQMPPHSMTVATFWMDETEVTVTAYKACLDANSCGLPGDQDRCNWGKEGRGEHPINCVFWEQAEAFCKWANKRLPTEEEWEFAARGSEGRRYPWGEAEPANQLCWDGKGNDRRTDQASCKVGSHNAGNTPTGLKDMAGNVDEWTASFYCPYTTTGYDSAKCSESRVARGSSWGTRDPYRVRGAVRSFGSKGTTSGDIGFRCARSK